MKSLFTSIPLQPALDCTENAIKTSTVELPPTYTRHYGPTPSTCFQHTTANTTNSYTVQLWALQFLLLQQKLLWVELFKAGLR